MLKSQNAGPMHHLTVHRRRSRPSGHIRGRRSGCPMAVFKSISGGARRVVVASTLLAACLLARGGAEAAGATFYVSTAGSDANSGTSAAAPFATPGRALAALQAGGPSPDPANPRTVMVAPGTYYLDSPLEITSAGGYAAWRVNGGAPGSVSFSGGVAVPASAWSAAPGAPGVYQAKLDGKVNMTTVRQLFVGGQRATLARTPMSKWAKLGALWLQAAPGQIPKYTGAQPYDVALVEAVIYEHWTAGIHATTSFSATGNITLRNSVHTQWATDAGAGARYYLQNIKEALDEPGEFYFDEPAQALLYMPRTGEDPTSLEAVVPALQSLVIAGGVPENGSFVDSVTFSGISFEHSKSERASCFAGSCNGQSADFLTTAAIFVNGGRGWHIDNCSVAHTGGYAVWFESGAQRNTISQSSLHDLGAGGVRVGVGASGVQSNEALRADGNVVADNWLYSGGHVFQEGAGVLAQQNLNSVITHNLIDHFIYTGVSCGWTWGYAPTSVSNNTISYNVISNIGNGTLSDMGCVYTLGRQPGTVVENNVCHDVWSFNYGGWGLYTDEGSSNITLRNNVVYHTKCAGMHQHYGTDNVIENNVFANVNAGAQDGGVRSSQHPGKCDPHTSNPDQGVCSSFTFRDNIVVPFTGPALYSTIPTGWDNMTVSNNTYWGPDVPNAKFPGSRTWTQWRQAGKDVLSVIADPKFTNNVTYNEVATGSPALAEGFKNIDISTVGPRY